MTQKDSSAGTLTTLAVLFGAALALSACGGGSDGDSSPAGSPPPTGTAPAPAPAPSAGDWWKPAAAATWQWQLTGTLNTSYDATVYDIDLVDASAATIAQLRAAGRRVVC